MMKGLSTKRRSTKSLSMKRFSAKMAGAAIALVAGISCTYESGPARLGADVLDRASFDKPGRVLVLRCGSLDCHGSTYRNYRLFGYGGQRLDPSHRPDAPDTTAAELALGYDATVGIEPERTRAIASHAEPPESSTFLRKARGTEHHKGGVRFVAGTPPDTCVRSWMLGAVDDAACTDALATLNAP